MDLLVLTNNPTANEREVTEELKKKAKLTPQHVVDVHFENKRKRDEALKRAKYFKLLNSP